MRVLILFTPLALLAPAVEARMPRPVQMRMEGYVGHPPEGRREKADLLLRCRSTDVRFQVTGATVVSSGLLASQVFDRVVPYRPNFILRGPDALLTPFCAAGPGTRWRMTGMWKQGTRDFLVGALEPAGDQPPAPPPAT